MAQLPQTIPTETENTAVSYDFTDVTVTTGIAILYGYAHKEQTTTSYSLTSQAIYSNDVTSSAATTSASATKLLDMDFDTSTFKFTRTLQGTATASFTIGGGEENTASAEADIYVIIKIRKYDGTTETEIASAQSETVTLGDIDGTGYRDYKTLCVNIDISTAVDISSDELLRVTVELWGARGSTNNATCYFAHDPKNRNDVNVLPDGANGYSAGYDPQTSIFQINIPFKPDL